MPDSAKRAKADFIVYTDFSGYAQARAQTCRILESIVAAHPERFRRWRMRSRIRADAEIEIETRIGTGTVARLAQSFDAVVFDLDDTLVPVMAPIGRAFAHLKADLFDRGHVKTSDGLADMRGNITSCHVTSSHFVLPCSIMVMRAVPPLYIRMLQDPCAHALSSLSPALSLTHIHINTHALSLLP